MNAKKNKIIRRFFKNEFHTKPLMTTFEFLNHEESMKLGLISRACRGVVVQKYKNVIFIDLFLGHRVDKKIL
jgi:hypothetical protein